MSEILSAGTIINSAYQILRLLGRGSESEIYLARDLLNSRDVVLKIVSLHGIDRSADKVKTSLLKREFTILRKLSYPLLPRVYDYIETPSRSIIVEEYIEGKTLKEGIEDNEHTDISGIFRIIYQVMGALHYLNRRKIIYRDLKPANIIITSRRMARLVDFDAARVYRKGKKIDTIPLGSLGFASPEHYGYGQTDERSEVFSAGALLYYLLTRRNPADNPLIFENPRELNPALSEELSNLIIKATRLEPAERHRTIKEFMVDLQKAAGALLSKERLLFCPQDIEEMEVISVGDILIDLCPHCAGLWCDATELEKIEALASHEISVSTSAYWEPPSRPRDLPASGQEHICCPLCGSVLQPCIHRTEPGAQVNRCPDGCGHWLDGGVMKLIMASLEGADAGHMKAGGSLLRRLREIRDRSLKPLLMQMLGEIFRESR
jgi:serine/threonine protein kinase